MAKLTTQQRKDLPDSAFAGPNRTYPVSGMSPENNRSHAKNAKSRAAQFASPALEKKIDAKANKVLGKKGAPPKAAGRKRPIAKPKASKPMGKPGIL